jgi:hypothetical protein
LIPFTIRVGEIALELALRCLISLLIEKIIDFAATEMIWKANATTNGQRETGKLPTMSTQRIK